MTAFDIDTLLVGAGPANLALAIALEELAPAEVAAGTLILEQADDIVWQRGMMLPWAQSQVSFLKDLVTLRNPRSRFTFVNYLHSIGRLDDFINLGSAVPYRQEISGYFAWVAESLTHTKIDFGRGVSRSQALRDPSGAVTGWRVHLTDGTALTCRDLVVGVGRDAHVPEVFKDLPADRAIHSTRFTEGFATLDERRTRRVSVIGAAQSAAEMLWTAHQRLPQAECTMIMRSIGLNSYESSKFTNEIFYPSFIDDFHGTSPNSREQLLREMHRTNYAGLSPAMLDTLYKQTYLEKLTGQERLRMVTMTDVTAAVLDGDEVVLTLSDRRTGEVTEHRCDTVLLGTGFERGMPWLIRDLSASAGITDPAAITVDRNYRLQLPEGSTATCHLQGVNEATHGIADSLLSVLAARAGDIVTDLLAVRARGADQRVLRAPAARAA
ncbi:L-ornithine N(5)-monooxygenase [Streptomyces sp. RB17]|uniref:SidA/IucD/PvdA family monooxygenase n=1 Tax=Streptomyces sp. RB17 TaxID=2585197 RepID=UPI00130B9D25|nr:SidA/IucD/PvdA family monooxygenase [Streptomyces sp. RB17]MQY35024.1 L-ornithine N(5)-monooxygenase [Streptomyces sp. RB17]